MYVSSLIRAVGKALLQPLNDIGTNTMTVTPMLGGRVMSTQEFLAGDLITKTDPNKAKFCVYCGSFIEDDKMRDWHRKNEHPGTNVAAFCICCGDTIGSNPDARLRHYKVVHRGETDEG